MPGTEYRAIMDELREIRALIDGGPKPSEGIIVRLDRVERIQLAGMWVVGIVLVASVAVVVPAGWAFFDRMNRMEQQHTVTTPPATSPK